MYFGIKISRKLFVRIIKKNIWIVLAISILAGAACAYISSIGSKNQYSVSSEMVQNDNNYSLVSSYSEFVQSRRFKQILTEQVNKSKWKNESKKIEYTVDVVSNGSESSNTPFFNLVVTSDNVAYAKFLAQQGETQLIANIGKYLSGANISLVSKSNKVTVKKPFSGIVKRFEYGFIIAFIIIFIFKMLADLTFGNIKDEEFVSDVFGKTNFGTIEIENAGE
ncbi:hypothetical protein [Lactiplantibacillus herbarum]|uniref:hypothetical protein n=1 Tax=Lactiplantibacillus herbarum TaxID=1670446 RepID=UPI00064E15DF|nr:hypothetical protein [Lactiplantibacillus herbarum]